MLLYSHFKTFFSQETFSSVSTQISMRCEGDFKSDSFGGITHQSSLSTLSLLKLLEIYFLKLLIITYLSTFVSLSWGFS